MKKGFTLIELLAVIVILAIIALIAVPIVLSLVEDARKSSAIQSAKLYVDGLSKKIAANNLTTGLSSPTCLIDDGIATCDNIDMDYNVKGEKPKSGYVYYTNGKVSEYSVCVMGYRVDKNGNNITATKDSNCSSITQPTDPNNPTNPTQQTQYGYTTYDRVFINGTSTMAMTDVTIGTDGYTNTGKNAYLKYNLTNGAVADGEVPVACIYTEGRGELCIETNNYSGENGTAQRILDYFGYSAAEWTKVDNYNWNDPTGTLNCNIVSILATTCYADFDTSISSYTVSISSYTNGKVLVVSYPNLSNHYPDGVTGKHRFNCEVNTDNSASCYY